MHVWFVLLSLLINPVLPMGPDPIEEPTADTMRYRGIEQLLAKFDAEAQATSDAR